MDFDLILSGDLPASAVRTALVVPVSDVAGPVSSVLTDDEAAAIVRLQESGVFKGKAEEVYALPSSTDAYALVLLAGVGKPGTCTPENLRRAGGRAVESLRRDRIERVILECASDWPAAAFVEGVCLGQYRFDKFKATSPDAFSGCVASVGVLCTDQAQGAALKADCRYAASVCENANWARDLANRPSNDLTPAQLAYEAKSIADHYGCAYDFLDEGKMSELGMNALLGVSRGSSQPSKLILLSYHCGPELPTLALVGKGITFDTGGVSIKPSEGMHEMKFDMCGASAVLGAMRTVVQTKPRVNVVCVVPAVENVIGSRAQRPGDVVRAYNGKTIEVNNTDAEGRLILADALAYTVDTYRPDVIVDLATLTGACVVALGHHAAGVMANNDKVFSTLQGAADATGERIWRFPLWDDYGKLIEGTHADLSNIGPPKEAGAIMGGCFLKEFVKDTPWAHIDIAGTAWGVKNVPYWDTKHATGYGVRLLSEWIRRETTAAKK
ncbi:MAG: leucyl aminopeptidase [Candidatus Hydrogenedentes bacterium]|nr:leucyl aminopeptidase [Candidatus Hydrogenedentota bacterium]